MVRPDYCAVDHLQAGLAAAAVIELEAVGTAVFYSRHANNNGPAIHGPLIIARAAIFFEACRLRMALRGVR